VNVFLRRDDQMYQFNSTSTLIEGRGFDGSGGSGDCHIRTAAAGCAHAVPAYRHIKNNYETHARMMAIVIP
jgi:hypothetical protein